MTTNPHQWERLGRPHRPDGHRFFRHLANRDAIAIADNSGDVPESTDDGILWLDHTRKIDVSMASWGVSVCLPVRKEREPGGTYRVGITIDDLAWLLSMELWHPMSVNVSPELRKLVSTLGLIPAIERVEAG